jgi:two-component system, LytTR family, response regulator
MEKKRKITVVIVDDDPEAIFNLESFLQLMPEVEILGKATGYRKAISLISEQEPDLVFLDIEMPGKTGFELLDLIENECGKRSFGVIFHTAYDKYSIQALREAAFDYLLKPPSQEEVRNAISRFIDQRINGNGFMPKPLLGPHKNMIPLPTTTGLQFVPKTDIVYLESQKSGICGRSGWVAVLNNRQTIRLRNNTNAAAILGYLGSDEFLCLSQSVIVNLAYVNNMEYKTRMCYLFPPFYDQPLKVSRQYLAELKERFDVL